MKRSCGSTSAGASSRTTAARRARRDLAALERRDARQVLRRAVVKPHLVAGAQRPRAGQHRDPRVEAAPGQPCELGRRQPVARARRRRGRGRAGSRRRGCPACDHLGLVVVHLHAAHAPRARRRARRVSASPASDLAATTSVPGDDRADALEREDAVHGQAGRAGAAARLGALARRARARPAARPGRARPARSRSPPSQPAIRRAVEELAHVRRRQLEPARSSTRSALVSATTPRGTPSSSMMARCSRGLRHDAVVGGDDEQDEVDAGGARPPWCARSARGRARRRRRAARRTAARAGRSRARW